MSSLAVTGLSRRYGQVEALADVGFAVASGVRTAIVGPSGSGKTTLLRIIAGFEAADAGQVALDGEVLVDGSSGVPAHLRGIGIVTQDGSLFPHLSIADNIGFGLARRDAARETEIMRLMDAVKLPRSMAQRRPHELSGGQQQRVALARALIIRPRLMLLDEPFSALDSGLRDEMRRTVVEVLSGFAVTAVLVTHDQSEALSFAQQLIVLREGHLAQAGPPRALYYAPRDADLARFLGAAVILDAQIGDGLAQCVLGRVPVLTGSGSGPATIMLRPEQIRIAAVGGSERSHDGAHGRVVDVEFGAGNSLVTIAIENAGAGFTLRLSVPEPDLPTLGAVVGVEVVSPAYVFRGAGRSR